MILKMVVACSNAQGAPDFFFCKVEGTEDEYNDGDFYTAAQGLAADEGYEGDMVTFDENDGPSWLFEHFVWDSASITKP